MTRPSPCPLARDKLQEARFFLSQLRRTKGAQPNCRYYASALVSAARSVTWVLQAELRPPHGAAFDHWWDEAKKSLAGQLRAFEAVRDARNAVHKRGNVIVRIASERRYSGGPVSMIKVIENPAIPGHGEIELDLRPDAQEALGALTDERVAALSSEELDQVVQSKVALLSDLSAKIQSLAQVRSDWRYEVGLGEEPLPFVEFVAELTSYLAALDQLIAQADAFA